MHHSAVAIVCLHTEYAKNPYKCKTHHSPELADLQSFLCPDLRRMDQWTDQTFQSQLV